MLVAVLVQHLRTGRKEVGPFGGNLFERSAFRFNGLTKNRLTAKDKPAGEETIVYEGTGEEAEGV